MTLLDRVLPRYDFSERHSVRFRDEPTNALAAFRSVTPGDVPVVRALFRLRGLPAAAARPVWEQLLETGFCVLAEDASEVVVGAIGRPWLPREPLRRDVDFAEFDQPGFAKMAMSVAARDSILSTETRVLLTDARARRRFRAYWLVVRPFSGLIRRLWLAAATRAGECSTPQR